MNFHPKAIAKAAVEAYPDDPNASAYEAANMAFDEASNQLAQLEDSLRYIRRTLKNEGDGQFSELVLECCYALGDLEDVET